MKHTNHFIGLETKAEMNSLAIGVIGEIMGEIHTSAFRKVIKIARTLRDLELAWNIKKDSSPQGAPKENSHFDCTIDVAKVESLLEPWTLEEILRREG